MSANLPPSKTEGIFIAKALEKILNDRELRRSQHAKLRQECESALTNIKAHLKTPATPSGHSSTLPRPISDGPVVDADQYFLPFELACKSRAPRIVNAALDILQKLIAYGHLRGVGADPDNADRKLMDRIVDTICSCFTGTQTDEGVQLQIIKALLTIMTSPTCDVHGGTVILAVRCCYNIYLASKSPVNQTTAKATLTQVLSSLFQRMESEPTLVAEAQEKMGIAMPNSSSQQSLTVSIATTEGDTPQPGSPEAQSTPDTKRRVIPVPPPGTEGLRLQADNASEEFGEMQSGIQPSSVGGAAEDELSEEVSRFVDQVIKSALIGYERELTEQGKSRTNLPKEEDGSTHSEPIETSEAALPAFAAGDTPSSASRTQFSHVLQKDGYQVFKALCKLSEKDVMDGSDARSTDYRSKVLSLELILSVLQNSGPVFRTGAPFLALIKHQLCLSLSRNGTSAVPAVFELSLSIFTVLLSSFKTHLKMQVEVFLKEIFLHILETSSSSYQHKWLVLQTLNRICSDAQTVVDIYINYDCDLSLHNVFETLVNNLSRIAQGRHATDLGAAPHQEGAIRIKGLECLVHILRGMVEWSKELYTDPNTTGLTGQDAGQDVDLSSDETDSVEGPNTRHRRSASALVGDHQSGRDQRQVGGITSTDSPEQLESLKLKKELVEQGIVMFVNHPKKGLKFLQEKGLIGKSPKEVAQFFHEDDRLDKTAIGEVLGESETWCKEIMYAYVDYLDFNGVHFVSALRLLLSKFRLPGEAQKIDRIMEKFASRFCATNPNLKLFASADAAYVLAYSVIMLTTDLHSTRVKRKMTKEEYVRMNRGINDNADLPQSFLEEIFDDILKNEIRMRDSARVVRGTVYGAALYNEKQRRSAYTQEREVMKETAKALMDERKGREAIFTSATRMEHVRPMFKTAWTSMLAAFSIALKDCDEQDVVILCLEGFRCAIRVACVFGLQLERDAFVQSLAKFTKLTTSTGLAEMRPKHIEVIKTLLVVAYTDGNYLQSSWLYVMRCISQLELAQLISTGVNPQVLLNTGGVAGKGGGASKRGGAGKQKDSDVSTPRLITQLSMNSVLGSGDQKKFANLQEQVGGTSSQSVVVAVDRIFTGSVRLDGAAIVDFVTALSKVSGEELSIPSGSRMYCLQRIVEIAYYNMDRIRLEWSRIWAILGKHFNTAGCHSNEEVCSFVIDSLRQLSMKFLERGEFSNFRFQKEFLRPFEHTMATNPLHSVQDLVVRCMQQMVCAKASNIRSGWKNIFSVFTLAAATGDQAIVEMAFESTNQIFEMYFALSIDSFQDGIMCLSEFACNSAFPDISMEAIRLIRQCAKHISDTPELFQGAGIDESYSLLDADRVWHKAWFPVFFELSRIITRCKLDVRTRALTVMFEIMKSCGQAFLQHWWVDLFSMVYKIFDVSKFTDVQFDESEWKTTTCNHALYAIMDVFVQYFEILSPVILQSLLGQLEWCVHQNNEQLARSSANCLENFVLLTGTQFLPEVWDKICQCVENIREQSVPSDLMAWQPLDPGELSGSVHSLDRDSLSSFATTSSIAPPPTPTPSIYDHPLVNSSTHMPLPSSSEDHSSQQLPEGVTQQEEEVPAISEETSHEQAESVPGPEIVVDEETPPAAEVGVTRENHETEENEATAADGKTSPDSELEGTSADKEPLLHTEEEKETEREEIDLPAGVESLPKTSQESSKATGPLVADKQEPTELVADAEKPAAKDKDEKKWGLFGRPRASSNAKQKEKEKRKSSKGKVPTEMAGSWADAETASTRSALETADLGKSSKQSKAYRSQVQSLFKTLLIKSVIQLELIHAIDNIIFYPTSSRNDDERNMAAVKGDPPFLELKGEDPLMNSKGMYHYIKSPQMWALLDSLENLHSFARQFNSNTEQRVVLMKAGFRGRAKPNLLRQETCSLASLLRLLFLMLNDPNRHDFRPQVQERLLGVIKDSLQYFLSLEAENHRETWTPALLVIFTRTLMLDSDTFKHHISAYYHEICQLVMIDLKVELRTALRWLLGRIGREYSILCLSESAT